MLPLNMLSILMGGSYTPIGADFTTLLWKQ
ncbi:hypothetical protein LINGRAHAP2_LOCUS14333 [Linum grandiflorum]